MGIYDFSPDRKWFHVLFGKFVFKDLRQLYLVTQLYQTVKKLWRNVLLEGISTALRCLDSVVTSFHEGDCFGSPLSSSAIHVLYADP